MREFTPEEKELIINTPITRECFDVDFEEFCEVHKEEWDRAIEILERKRKRLTDRRLSEKNRDRDFILLVRMIPNSYKVVKL